MLNVIEDNVNHRLIIAVNRVGLTMVMVIQTDVAESVNTSYCVIFWPPLLIRICKRVMLHYIFSVLWLAYN